MKYSPLGCWLALGSVVLCLSDSNYAVAQIVPDATLPNNSIVTPQGNASIIEGGTRAGGNLFHSFRQFSIPTGGEAFFNNAVDVQNIFSRVTGGSISNIDGLIRANGTANLFLLNPNGIIFGANARLNIGGSFFGSTASSIRFGDGTEFSASNSQATPLLTISVPIGLQYGSNPGRITVQGPGQNLVSQSLLGTTEQVQAFINAEQTLLNDATGLQVQPGRTLALVGGEVALEGGLLKAPEGRIEIGSVAHSGQVSLNAVDSGWVVGYKDVPTFGNIQLSQRSLMTTSGNGGGNIQVQGSLVTLADESGILSNTFGNKNGIGVFIQAEQLNVRNGSSVSVDTFGIGSGGILTVNASQSVELKGTAADGQTFSSLIANTFGPGAAGSLTITTGRLTVQGGAGVQANNALVSQGQGGTLTINASELVELSGTTPNGRNASNITVYSGGLGTGGNLTINTGTLRVQDGALVSAATFGEGQGGNIFVNATDSVQLIGSSVDGRAFSRLVTDTQGSGVGGNVTLTTGRLLIQDGAFIAARTFSSGAAGNLNINASESIELIGTSANGNSVSSLTTTTSGSGNAGNLTIQTRRLSLFNGAAVTAETFGDGNGGNILVQASDLVEVVGTSSKGFWTALSAGISGGDNPNRSGGDITIETGTLSVRDGGRVSTEIFRSGNGGNIQIQARDLVEVVGFEPSPPNSTFEPNSSISSGVSNRNSAGNGGNIAIQTRTLSLRDGGAVSSSVFGQGNGGDIQVRASERVEVLGTLRNGLGSNLTTTLFQNTVGKAGNISIDTQVLSIRDGGVVATETFGQGDAGNLQIRATELVEVVGEGPPIPNNPQLGGGGFSSRLSSTVGPGGVGTRGTLTIETGTLSIRDGGQVWANLFGGSGKGGDIQVRASNLVEVVGAGSVRRVEGFTIRPSSSLSTQVAGQNGEKGESINQGGNITIETQVLSLRDGGIVSSSIFGKGNAGNIEITASDRVEVVGFANGGNVSQLSSDVLSNSEGKGGDLKIDSQVLTVRDGGDVSAITNGVGNAGNIQIRATDAVELGGDSTDISTTVLPGATGDGGNIMLETRRLTLQDDATISSGTSGNGDSGDILLRASEAVELSGSSNIRAITLFADISTPSAIGQGGNITIETGRLYLTQDSEISAFTNTQGTGGTITVRARESLQLYNGGSILVGTFGAGNAGSISVTAPEVDLAGDFTAEDGKVRSSSLSTQSQGTGAAGDVTIDTGRLIVRDGARVVTSTFEAGNGGTLSVTADEVELSGIGVDGFSSGLFASSEGSGAAGDVTIDAGRLIVRDGARVSVSGIGSGRAGNLNIIASSVVLDNNGSLRATTAAGTEGNINVRSNSLILRRGSNITTNATGEATGGNITLNTGVLAALENSDINANAEQSFGGQVRITAQAIFGTQFRSAPILDTPESDITATSAAGPQFSGEVAINTPDVDPSSGLIELPQNLVDVSALIVEPCAAARRGSSFVVTGRGGIPPDARESLNINPLSVDWVTPSTDGTQSPRMSSQTANEETGYQVGDRITEATGWIINDKGQVVLIASHPNMMGDRWWRTPPGCTVSPH